MWLTVVFFLFFFSFFTTSSSPVPALWIIRCSHPLCGLKSTVPGVMGLCSRAKVLKPWVHTCHKRSSFVIPFQVVASFSVLFFIYFVPFALFRLWRSIDWYRPSNTISSAIHSFHFNVPVWMTFWKNSEIKLLSQIEKAMRIPQQSLDELDTDFVCSMIMFINQLSSGRWST